MRRANLVEPYKILLEDVKKPSIAANQVLIKIMAVGICASDIQMYHGLHKYMTFPVVIGHEAAAEVVEVGSDAQGYAVGDLVTVEPQVYCGKCYPCSIGRFNVCESLRVLGVHKDGFMCEYAAIEPDKLHKCPAGMDPFRIALSEPAAVGVGAVKRARSIAGANVVVVGAGTIGNLTAQAAQALGAGKVMVTDISEEKLMIARKSGIQCALNTANVTLKQAVEEQFGARKADVMIDCAATSGSFASILDAARPSSAIIITGNYKAPITFEMPKLQRQEIEMIGHMMYVREDFADAIAFLNSGAINAQGIISKVFPLDSIDEAFRYIDDNAATTMKVIVKI